METFSSVSERGADSEWFGSRRDGLLNAFPSLN